MGKHDRQPNGERPGSLKVVTTLVNSGEHGERQQEGTHGLHADPLTGSHQRIESIHGEVGPDQWRRRQGLGKENGDDGAKTLTDAVTQGSERSDVSGDGERNADGRVDVATTRVRQTPNYRRDTYSGGEGNLHDARVFSLPMGAEGTADKHKDHGPDHFTQQVPVESSLLQLINPDGSGQPCWGG